MYKNAGWLEQKYIHENKSLNDIAEMCNVDKSTIVRWIKKYDITKSEYDRRKKRQEKKAARQRKRSMAYKYLGGRCLVCGYHKCQNALEFHHLYPKQKEFNIANGYNKSVRVIKKELDKCVLLCNRCHQEAEKGYIDNSRLEEMERERRRNFL